MEYYIVAIPIFNSNMEVEAYSIRYQNANIDFTYNQMFASEIANSPGIDTLNSIGIEPFTGGKPIFVPLNKFGLLTDVYKSCNIQPELMVYMLSNDILIDDIYLEKCRILKTAGFSLAITNIDTTNELTAFFELADYIIISTSKNDYKEQLISMRRKFPEAMFILSDIADLKTFETIKIANTFYEGKFYIQPITKGSSSVSPLKINAMRLLKIVGEEDFELKDASKIIEKDMALSISLLKFINSPAIGITSKVNSIQNAVAILGQKETIKWVTVAVSSYIAADKPNEITRLSLIRAKFAESLATIFEMGIHAPSLFLMGLFSLLDVILEKPMLEAIKEISVDDNIEKALVYRQGPFHDILNLIVTVQPSAEHHHIYTS